MERDESEGTWVLGGTLSVVVALYFALLIGGIYAVLGGVGAPLGFLAILIVIGGAFPPAWMRRRKPMWRFISTGVMVGCALGLLLSIALAAA